MYLLAHFCVAALWWEIGRKDCLEKAKIGQIRLLRVEKLLRKRRKNVKGTEASELEKETAWVTE